MNEPVKTKMSNITQKWVDLLAPFSADYSARLSASELARKSKIPQQSASRYLDSLTKLNLIGYQRTGQNKMFYFDLKKPASQIIFNLIESQKALKFQLTKTAAVINEILENCESLIIFGSYASGEAHKESDLDLVVLGSCKKEQIKKIKQKQVIEINEHYISYSEFSQKLKARNPLALEIKSNHIFFGDISKLVGLFSGVKNG